jgi:hypothetical protein
MDDEGHIMTLSLPITYVFPGPGTPSFSFVCHGKVEGARLNGKIGVRRYTKIR